MRLRCPHCAAAYEVPARLLLGDTSRRPVRCARCGAVWTPDAATTAAAAEEQRSAGAPAPPAAPAGETLRPPPSPRIAPAPALRAAAADAAAPEAADGGGVQADLSPPPPPALRAPLPRAPQRIEPPLPARGDVPPGGGGGGAGRLALWAGWILSIAVIAAAIAALWLFRDEVVRLWPPAARLFSAFG